MWRGPGSGLRARGDDAHRPLVRPLGGNDLVAGSQGQLLRDPASGGPRHPPPRHSRPAATRFASVSRSFRRSSLPLSVIGISALVTKKVWRGSL